LANTQVTGLGTGVNQFIWTVSNGVCASSADTVSITSNPAPSVANAGTDQSLCGDSTNLAAIAPQIGNGAWSIITGAGNLGNALSPNTKLTSLSQGQVKLVWTVAVSNCPASTDTLVINSFLPIGLVTAGTDQVICGIQSVLSGNNPQNGVGEWFVITGSARLSDSLSANSQVNNLSAGLNQFVWTVTNGVCPSKSDTVSISSSSALNSEPGGPRSVCGTDVVMAAVPVSGATGLWTLVAGTGTILNPNNPTTSISGLSIGQNVFRWKVSNPGCPSDSETVIITAVAIPTPAQAGASQNICGTTTTLTGNTPVIGQGVWRLVSGSATIADSLLPNSGVSNLGIGANAFRWTISNAPCPSSFDIVTFTGNSVPVANAGLDKLACGSTTTLQAIPGQGSTGLWIQISGSGSIVDPNNDTTAVTNLAQNLNRFVWIANLGNCSASDTINILNIVNPLFLGNDTTICLDSSLVLDAGQGFASYLWNNTSASSSITVNQSGTYTVEVVTTDACVFRDTIVVNVNPCVSVKEVLGSGVEVSVYPNPFRNKIYLEVDKFKGREMSYKLITTNGVEVFAGNASSDNGKIVKEIVPGRLANGMYILEITLGESVIRKKLILE